MQPIINKRKCAFAFLACIFIFTNCKKLVEADNPVNRVTGGSVYNEDLTATAVLTNIYSSLSGSGLGNNALLSISKRGGLSSDELVPWSGAGANDIAYFTNTLAARVSSGTPSAGHEIWSVCYNFIFVCNSALEGLTASNALTPSVKKQLLGEAYFMRAFFYFYLVNLYGDVPLAVTTDYEVNRLLPKSRASKVYETIVSDLKQAQTLLSSSFLDGQLKEYKGTIEKVRPTYWAATALLARTYLYMGEWSNAESQASAIINSPQFSLTSLNDVFIKNSLEAIWQLQPVNTDGTSFWNTEDARTFVLTDAPVGLSSDHPVFLSSFLVNSFDPSDNRKTAWIGTYSEGATTYYFPYKYKIGVPAASVDEYHMVFRLAEQYLIRAEARAQLGNNSGSQSDVNAIRNRAGLSNTTANDKSSLLAAILNERRLELFTEWGHRWLDLKRTGNIDAIMNNVTPQKTNGSGTWKSYQQWYPLPIEDIQRDPNLTQNQGY